MSKPWLSHYPSHVAKEIDLSGAKSIYTQINSACDRFGSEIALTCMGTDLTYSNLQKAINDLAGYLQQGLGLMKGDRIAIMLPNIMQFPIAFLAAQKIGLIVINTNPLYTPREMKHQFCDSGANTIIILDVFLDKLEEIIADTAIKNIISCRIGDQLPVLKSAAVALIMKLKGLPPKHHLETTSFQSALKKGRKTPSANVEIDHEDIALLQYTGGTTGIAKGAVLTQKNILSNMLQLEQWVKDADIQPGEVVLTALPLYHIFALSVNFLTFLGLGCQMLLVPKPVPIENTAKLFKKYRITLMSGVNTLFNSLNNSRVFQLHGPFHLKAAVAGGMALQKSVKDEFQKITGTTPVEGYGLTEASPVTHCNFFSGRGKSHGIGYPIPSTEAMVVDKDFNVVSFGEPGELVVRGPQVMRGYWNMEEETKKVLRDGWLMTGDVACQSEDGYFEIVDRKKDLINVSGFNVYPNEIEEVISSHPKVMECGVIGVDDGTGSEVVTAFIVKKDDSLTESEIKTHCSDVLTNYKRPKVIHFQDELPKTNVGKVIRRQLRELGAGNHF